MKYLMYNINKLKERIDSEILINLCRKEVRH